MKIKLQAGDHFEIVKLTNEQYHKVCQAMFNAGASVGEYGDGYVNWDNYNYVGLSRNCVVKHWNFPNSFSDQNRLLTYADVFGDDEGWIEWQGGECPVKEGDVCQIKFRDSTVTEPLTNTHECYWKHNGGNGDIIAYHIVERAREDGPSAPDYSNFTTDELIRQIKDMQDEVRKRCKTVLGDM